MLSDSFISIIISSNSLILSSASVILLFVASRVFLISEEEDKKKDHEKILEEIIVENFPKMGKEIITQLQETQRVPNRINPRQNTSRHIVIKLTKIKHKEQY